MKTEKSGGIGLLNLKKRLEMIYTNSHQLVTELRENSYFAELNIQLNL